MLPKKNDYDLGTPVLLNHLPKYQLDSACTGASELHESLSHDDTNLITTTYQYMWPPHRLE